MCSQTLSGHLLGIETVDWSPDGNKIASGSADNTIRIWDAKTGTVLQLLQGHSDRVASINWRADNRLLASASYDGDIRIWNTETGASLAIIPTGEEPYIVAWSPDGSQLAYGGEDGVLAIVPAPAALLATAAPADG